jgi:hypothetical protein
MREFRPLFPDRKKRAMSFGLLPDDLFLRVTTHVKPRRLTGRPQAGKMHRTAH